MPGDENYSTNLPALGRFAPGAVSGGSDGSQKVTLLTNLAGEPIRFTFNEALDNIVRSGTIVMLNAVLGDLNEIQQGVMGNAPTEEDEARWGEMYQQAPVEPNQLVWVTEIRGSFTSNLDDEGNLPEDEDLVISENDDFCTTYWRVVNCVSYTDEKDVPYYEVTLESLEQAIIDLKYDPKAQVGCDFVVYYDKAYLDAKAIADAKIAEEIDEYTGTEETTEVVVEDGEEGEDVVDEVPFDPIRVAEVIVEIPGDWLGLFFATIGYLSYGFGEPGTLDLDWVPCKKTYQQGESVWQIIEDICGFNGLMVRYKRDKSCLVWDARGETSATSSISNTDEGVTPTDTVVSEPNNTDLAPLGDVDIGAFGKGIKFTYSKEGVSDIANVSGYTGKYRDNTWFPDEEGYETVKVTSEAAENILNGVHVEITLEVPADYRLQNTDMLTGYGKKELFKSVLGARGASCESETFALSTEVGMSLTGSSKIGGTTSILVTSLNRTTDAQQNKISTSITGTVLSQSGAGEEEGNTNIGWT